MRPITAKMHLDLYMAIFDFSGNAVILDLAC
jgi:hypothetical protein